MSVSQTNNHGSRDRPIGELLKELSGETSTLVRQELELAKAELGVTAKQMRAGAGMFGGAGVLGLLALGSLTACVIAALDTGMPFWLAALIVAVVYAAVAGVLALAGKKRIEEAAPPIPQTTETLKEDISWAKTRARSAGK